MKDLRLGDKVWHRGYEHIVCGRVKQAGETWFVLIIAPSDHYRVSADWVDVDNVELVARAIYVAPGEDYVPTGREIVDGERAL